MATGFQGVQAPNTGSLPQPGQQPNPFPIPGENNASQSSGFQVAATQPQPNKAGSRLGSLVGPAQAVQNGVDSLLTPAAGAAGAGTGIEGLGTAATGLEGLGASTEGIAGLGSAVTDLGTGAAGTSGLMSLLATIFA